MQKSYLTICSAIIVLFLLISPVLGSEGYKEINTIELKKWMDADDKPILANSLSPIEFGEGYIPGSTCIPVELMETSQLMPENLNTSLVFYCFGPG